MECKTFKFVLRIPRQERDSRWKVYNPRSFS